MLRFFLKIVVIFLSIPRLSFALDDPIFLMDEDMDLRHSFEKAYRLRVPTSLDVPSSLAFLREVKRGDFFSY